MDPSEIRQDKAFDTKWYHELELAPGLYTPGKPRRMVGLTRELLRAVHVESGGSDGGGARCLDLGLQEGLVSILMERRGASEVVGYDRGLRKARLSLVKRALDTNFDLIGGMRMEDLPAAMAAAGHDPFDVVIFSGVLYHMFDPFAGLAVTRGLVRNGGICLVETAAAFDDSPTMYFNTFGRFTAGGRRTDSERPRPEGMMPGSSSCFWYITPRCLDYILRLLRFEPIDLVYFNTADPKDGKPAEGRVAVACRAVTEPLAEPGDEWIPASLGMTGLFGEFLDWHKVTAEASEVDYATSRDGLVQGAAGALDLQASIAAMDPLTVDRERAVLALDAKY